MDSILDRPLPDVARALRDGAFSATELVTEALRRHDERGEGLAAYAHFDRDGALAAAREADRRLAASPDGAPPLCGIPVSVKDLYGVEGMPTFAGTARRLPPAWERDGWLVGRLRAQGAVFVGKTHTVELAYGAVGLNPNHATPVNPWDAGRARIPGGSSSGAGVSLLEGSALVALGSDTGGSIRIPASLTGTVGHKTTKGRWPTDGVVPLSSTLDTVGALTRTVEDALAFFVAVDPDPGEAALSAAAGEPALVPRVGVPRSTLWSARQPDVAEVLEAALDELGRAGWTLAPTEGALLDDAVRLYMEGGIAGAECRAFLERELPGWPDLLHPLVGARLATVPPMTSESYRKAVAARTAMEARAHGLFDGVDVLALPAATLTPPPVAEVEDLERYLVVNRALLEPTCGVGMLGLCALALPVGLDAAGMPVGLQLVGPGGSDGPLLAAALAAERVLGTARERLGTPPRLSRASPSR